MATKNSKHVHVVEFTYKQAITDIFGTIPFLPLPMRLIYGRKTPQNCFTFPEIFLLSANPKDFSNTEKLLKLLEEIIIS